MEPNETIRIPVHGRVDFHAAQNVASRIRMAIRNGFRTIVLDFEPETVLASAEFRAFVLASARFLEAQERRMEVRGVSRRQRALLVMANMGALVVEEDAPPEDGLCEQGAFAAQETEA